MVLVRRPLAMLALASTLAACSGAPPAAGTDDAPPVGQTASDLTGNDKTAFDYFLGKGLTNFQAAAIVGNLDQESGMDPSIAQPGGPGRGIAQWSVGGRWDTDASDNARWYASSNGQSVYGLTTQLDFIWYELTNFPSFGLAELQQTTTLSGAVVVFQNKFEACGACDESQRLSYAEAALQAYGNDAPTGSAPPPANDAGTTYGPCTVPGIDAPGECIATADCAALPDHVSTPGYCPGANDVQCCTGPSGAGNNGSGGNGGGGSGGAPSGDPGASSGGSAPGSSLDPGHATDGGKGSGRNAWNGASDVGDGNAGGCSAAGARGAGGGATWAFGVMLVGLARRGRRRARVG